MLGPAEEAILDKSLSTILRDPQSVTTQMYMSAYNMTYTYCSAPKDEYYIEGEAIYELIQVGVRDYTSGLSFKASVRDLADQAMHFQRASSLLEKVFSYIERFYVKASAYKGQSVERLSDLFYIHLYFNYIYKIEDSFTGLVFLELETMRRQSSQNCGYLRSVVMLYTEALRIAGQEGKTERFYQMYIKNYVDSTDFTMPISNLLRRTYLESFYARNIINDKGVAKEVVGKINYRSEEVLRYIMGLVRVYGSCKREYKVINGMEDEVRLRFRREYEGFLREELRRTEGFKDMYGVFCKIKKHIQANGVPGSGKVLTKIVKANFVDRPEDKQREIIRGMVRRMEVMIKECNSGADGSVDTDSVYSSARESIHDVASDNARSGDAKAADGCRWDAIGDVGVYRLVNNARHALDGNKAGGVRNMLKNNSTGMSMDDTFGNILDLFGIIYNDYAIDYYIARCQLRLLQGISPVVEKIIHDRLVELIGSSLLSRLKSGIITYMEPRCLLGRDVRATSGIGGELANARNVSIDDSTRISLYRHVNGFWNIPKQHINLHPLLSSVRNELVRGEDLKHRECMNINYSLSPVVFALNGTKYKMGTDLFSILFYACTSEERLTLQALKEMSGDTNFGKNVGRLVGYRMLGIERGDDVMGGIGSPGSGTAGEPGGAVEFVKVLNRKSKEPFVDLFEVPELAVSGESPANLGAQKSAIVESLICKFMKKHKVITSGELCRELSDGRIIDNNIVILPRDIESGVGRLVEKGYLNEKEDAIEYIP